MSYAMINAQKLMIEVWDHNSFVMNRILGYSTCPLIEIVNGDMSMSFDIMRKEGKKKSIPQCTIEFKCIFQEIFDYKINFVNFKSSSIIELKKGAKMNPDDNKHSELVLVVNDDKIIGDYNTSCSEKSLLASAPVWSKFDREILFRGSQIQLESASITLILKDVTSIFSKELTRKTIGLNNIFETGRIKTDLTLINEKTKDKFPAIVEGFAQIDHKVWYKQTGDIVTLYSKRKYLCIQIMRVENIRPAETKGTVDSFISVEWCGKNQRTRTLKENLNPVFNETLYFEVPFPEEWIKSPGEYIQKINE
jgi:hypothetical protein